MCAIVVQVRDLEPAEAEALLAELHVGAIAVAFRDRVGITLVNFVYRDGWIYGRIEDGPDLDALRHHQWAALEAREATGILDWRTVTVTGPVELLRAAESQVENREFEHAVEVLRSAVPTVLTPRDPLPRRVQVFRLHADIIAGREAHSRPHEPSASASVPLPAIAGNP